MLYKNFGYQAFFLGNFMEATSTLLRFVISVVKTVTACYVQDPPSCRTCISLLRREVSLSRDRRRENKGKVGKVNWKHITLTRREDVGCTLSLSLERGVTLYSIVFPLPVE